MTTTIGFLTHSVADDYGKLLWQGALDATRAADARLVSYPGTPLESTNVFEAQANIIYEFIDSQRIDGLVVSAAVLSTYVGVERLHQFLQRFDDMPLATIGLSSPGSPGVVIDNYTGLYETMEHLIKVHGFSKFAYFGGPTHNPEATVRYQAFTDGLIAHDLELNSQLVAPPNLWSDEAGAESMRLLLDERGLKPGVDFDVVVASSDTVAFGAMMALQQRGYRIPADVAITGFDADERTALLAAPLTSVYQPIREQARTATELVLAQLRGENVPETTTLPTSLVVRQSCGCQDAMVTAAYVGEVVSESNQTLSDRLQGMDTGDAQQVRLFADFVAEVEGHEIGIFLKTLNHALQKDVLEDGYVPRWQDVISDMRRRALPVLSAEQRTHAEDLWNQARVMVGRMAFRGRAYQRLITEMLSLQLQNMGHVLGTSFSIGALIEAVADQLPQIGIERLAMSLYADPDKPAEGVVLRMVMDETGARALEIPFDPVLLAPDDAYEQIIMESMVVLPLYFGTHQLGFCFVCGEPHQGHILEAVRMHLSGALESTMMFEKQEQAEAALQRAFDEVEQQVQERTAELRNEIEQREQLQQQVINAQKMALQELSSPIIPLMDGIIIMPLIGSIDSMRAQDITRSLLAGITQYRAEVLILDITGVSVVDTGIAQHLNKTIQAAKLKGTRTIVSGISEVIAETVVDLGIDWSDLDTTRDLESALLVALDILQLELLKRD